MCHWSMRSKGRLKLPENDPLFLTTEKLLGKGAGGSGSFPASDGIGIAVGCYFCSGTGCQRTADAFDVRQG